MTQCSSGTIRVYGWLSESGYKFGIHFDQQYIERKEAIKIAKKLSKLLKIPAYEFTFDNKHEALE